MPDVATLLLTVEDAFDLRDLGLTLVPAVTAKVEPGSYFAFAITPDGRRAEVEVSLSWADSVPGGFALVCRAPSMTRASLPPGTTIWLP